MLLIEMACFKYNRGETGKWTYALEVAFLTLNVTLKLQELQVVRSKPSPIVYSFYMFKSAMKLNILHLFPV